MARHNSISMTGAVLKAPFIKVDDDGNYKYSMCEIEVVRGNREVGDNKHFPKSENPRIISHDPVCVKEMASWKENDIVQIKGVIAVLNAKKSSFCTHCGEKNSAEGALVYVAPIFCFVLDHAETAEEAHKKIVEMREISNQINVIGTLCRDPKSVSPKEGLTITQYQIALNRKYVIRSDPPEIRSDYPWVKSYGENAEKDLMYLHTGSEVFIDGLVQARSVQRHSVCAACGKEYTWKERVLEIVPYETEYLTNYYTEEEIAAKAKEEAKAVLRAALGDAAVQEEEEDEEDFAPSI